jgi:peptide/nickel transport system permease protein
MRRPFGVIILAILELISGLYLLSPAVPLFIGATSAEIGILTAVLVASIAIFLAIVGALDFAVAYGLWVGKGWAWTTSIYLSMIGAVLGFLLLPLGVIILLSGVLRIYYLTRSSVAAFFGVEGEVKAQVADIKYTLHLLRKNPLVMVGAVISLFFIILALLANVVVDPRLATTEGYPNSIYPFERKYMWNAGHFIQWGPGIALYQGPEYFWLGTDSYGRDLLKMIILALPIDLYNAAIITIISAIFGTILGAVAGYVGGAIDEAMLRITDVFFAFPGLVLALVFAAMFGRNMETLQLAIVLVWWPPYVRLMRGQVLSEKEKPYVEALRALGASHFRILFRHVMLNSIYPILVQATMDFGGVILTFSALMFLGFSPSPALPELGNLAADGYGHIFDAPWVMIFPGLTMLFISLAFNLVGDGLRDVLDPRLRR